MINGLKSKIPGLELQGEKLVIKLSKAIKDEAKNSQDNKMPGYAAKMIKGINKGFNDDKTGKSAVQKWLGVLDTTIKNWKLPELIAAVKVDSSALTDFYTAQGGNIGLPTKQYKDGGFVKKVCNRRYPRFRSNVYRKRSRPRTCRNHRKSDSSSK